MSELNVGKLRREALDKRYGKIGLDPRDVIVLCDRIDKASAIQELCAAECAAEAAAHGGVELGEIATDAGKALHEAMAVGARNCEQRIRDLKV